MRSLETLGMHISSTICNPNQSFPKSMSTFVILSVWIQSFVVRDRLSRICFPAVRSALSNRDDLLSRCVPCCCCCRRFGGNRFVSDLPVPVVVVVRRGCGLSVFCHALFVIQHHIELCISTNRCPASSSALLLLPPCPVTSSPMGPSPQLARDKCVSPPHQETHSSESSRLSATTKHALIVPTHVQHGLPSHTVSVCFVFLLVLSCLVLSCPVHLGRRL